MFAEFYSNWVGKTEWWKILYSLFWKLSSWFDILILFSIVLTVYQLSNRKWNFNLASLAASSCEDSNLNPEKLKVSTTSWKKWSITTVVGERKWLCFYALRGMQATTSSTLLHLPLVIFYKTIKLPCSYKNNKHCVQIRGTLWEKLVSSVHLCAILDYSHNLCAIVGISKSPS